METYSFGENTFICRILVSFPSCKFPIIIILIKKVFKILSFDLLLNLIKFHPRLKVLKLITFNIS